MERSQIKRPGLERLINRESKRQTVAAEIGCMQSRLFDGAIWRNAIPAQFSDPNQVVCPDHVRQVSNHLRLTSDRDRWCPRCRRSAALSLRATQRRCAC